MHSQLKLKNAFFKRRPFHYAEHDSSLIDTLGNYIVFSSPITSRNNLNFGVKASTATHILHVERYLLTNAGAMLMLFLSVWNYFLHYADYNKSKNLDHYYIIWQMTIKERKLQFTRQKSLFEIYCFSYTLKGNLQE